MDSHFGQVLKARASSVDAPPRAYFAYSTILDREAFEAWRAEHGYEFFKLPDGELAEARDVELVYDFPSRWWGGRVSGLADKPGASVFGRLFTIPGADWPVVQHKEGAVTGMCVEREVKVRVGDRELTATAFTTNPDRRSDQGEISQRFVEAFLRGGQAAGLPEEYLSRVREGAASK